jgi:hypothetical protein
MIKRRSYGSSIDNLLSNTQTRILEGYFLNSAWWESLLPPETFRLPKAASIRSSRALARRSLPIDSYQAKKKEESEWILLLKSAWWESNPHHQLGRLR